jgi:hypothetical protein
MGVNLPTGHAVRAPVSTRARDRGETVADRSQSGREASLAGTQVPEEI